MTREKKTETKSQRKQKVIIGLALGLPALISVLFIHDWGVFFLMLIFIFGGGQEFRSNIAPRMVPPGFKKRNWALIGTLMIVVDATFIQSMSHFMGWQWVGFLLFNNYLTDITAYLVGSELNKKYELRPIWRAANDSKSWASSGIAVAFSTLFSTFVSYQFMPKNFVSSYQQVFLMSLLGACGAIAGDLYESRLKRKMKIKDSGGIFREHGGFIDRTDSVFGCTAMYLIYFIILFFLKRH